MRERGAFYEKVVSELIPDRSVSILVCGGGALDRAVFLKLGFQDVTISNLDTREVGASYAPFKWQFENAEALRFPDQSFDYVVIHAAIHHATAPHKVLLEMYRVAKNGMLAFEARDSMLMQILERLQLTQKYEHAAVYYNDCKYGGVNNTEIPNFVFRWTEREVEKTIKACAPCFEHKFVYRYGAAFPCTPELEAKGGYKMAFLTAMRPFFWLFSKMFVRQQNLFAFYIQRQSEGKSKLLPWLIRDEIDGRVRFNKEWGDRRYRRPSQV